MLLISQQCFSTPYIERVFECQLFSFRFLFRSFCACDNQLFFCKPSIFIFMRAYFYLTTGNLSRIY